MRTNKRTNEQTNEQTTRFSAIPPRRITLLSVEGMKIPFCDFD